MSHQSIVAFVLGVLIGAIASVFLFGFPPAPAAATHAESVEDDDSNSNAEAIRASAPRPDPSGGSEARDSEAAETSAADRRSPMPPALMPTAILDCECLLRGRILRSEGGVAAQQSFRICAHFGTHSVGGYISTDEHGSFSGNIDAYLEWVGALLARYSWTMHLIANVLIEWGDAEEVAAAESYGVALHRSEEPKPHLNLATGFRYLDRFERREDRWKIASRVAVSEWSIQIPKNAWWEIPDSLLKGQPDRSDALYALLSGIATRPCLTRGRPRSFRTRLRKAVTRIHSTFSPVRGSHPSRSIDVRFEADSSAYYAERHDRRCHCKDRAEQAEETKRSQSDDGQ